MLWGTKCNYNPYSQQLNVVYTLLGSCRAKQFKHVTVIIQNLQVHYLNQASLTTPYTHVSSSVYQN